MALNHRNVSIRDLYFVAGFALLSLIYCHPQLQGQRLIQHDVLNWRAMAQEGMAHHERTGEQVLWSNSMFGGMPTFTYYVPKTNNYVFYIHRAIESLLGMPATMLFLALVCFYLLMRVLGAQPWIAAAGAVAYAFSSFIPVSIAAGHQTKVITMAYLPAMLAGLHLLYQRYWWTGMAVLGISLSLMIGHAHYQIIFYAIILVLFYVLARAIEMGKSGQWKTFLLSSSLALGMAALAAGPSMQSILSTMEYGKATMRGGESELTLNKTEEKSRGGLDKDYAFRWSNGIGETFSLLIPDLYGGASTEKISETSSLGATLDRMGVGPQGVEQVTGQAPMYWGPQPFLSGPVYFGAVVCLLFVFGLLVVPGPHKWWMAALALLSILMSWGKHFPGFNYFLFDHLPLMNRFRTPTMVLSLAQLVFPALGFLGIKALISRQEASDPSLEKKIKIAAGIVGGFCVLIGLAAGMFFSFRGGQDGQILSQYSQIFGNEEAGSRLLEAIRDDRASRARVSAWISAGFIAAAAAMIWAYIRKKWSAPAMVIGIGLLTLVDLWAVDRRYLNAESFVDEMEMEMAFAPRPVDQQILQDKEYYRVLDLTTNVYNDAMGAYHHKLIGGYSPAKLEIYQDLIDMQLGAQGGMNAQVLNMLNTRYIIYPGQDNQPQVSRNPGALGNAWFPQEIKWVKTADEEMLALNAEKLGELPSPDLGFSAAQTAVIREDFRDALGKLAPTAAQDAKIELTEYGLMSLGYRAQTSQDALAVFSEIYYPYGWKAYIDDQEVPILRANYLLRALKIPAGEHEIRFVFHPKMFYLGDQIALIASILLLSILGYALFVWLRPFWRKEA